ncbi:hypothetical protein L1049_000387 [Liquidambar formosana]|uniref:Uncharacterized protein n=1 Tax=Liquidambar formosana TaxID=63359 RepID=A0AAP0N8W5_LIQFO
MSAQPQVPFSSPLVFWFPSSSSSTLAMSSILTSQGVVLATAMAVSAGTVILLAFRHQKIFSVTQFPLTPLRSPRSCISSEERKREKKKKRVHFAEDVVDPSGDSKEFRKKHGIISSNSSSTSSSSSSPRFKKKSGGGGKVTGMPANRVALYNGILRDRVVHRLAYSY